MKQLLSELSEFKEMLVANTSTDFEFENNANEEFGELAAQLQTLIDKYTLTPREELACKLADYICNDDMDEALNALEQQLKEDGEESADCVVDMWEPLEWQFTVNRLLDEIGYFYIYPQNSEDDEL